MFFLLSIYAKVLILYKRGEIPSSGGNWPSGTTEQLDKMTGPAAATGPLSSEARKA